MILKGTIWGALKGFNTWADLNWHEVLPGHQDFSAFQLILAHIVWETLLFKYAVDETQDLVQAP
jgi:hypothetical protein